MGELSEHGNKVKAGQLLTKCLREISHELTEVVKDPDTGDDRLATKAEALVRNMWKMALGFTESKIVNGTMKDTIHAPDKSMMARIFDRLEGQIPIAVDVGRKKITASERVSAENTKRLNALSVCGDGTNSSD